MIVNHISNIERYKNEIPHFETIRTAIAQGLTSYAAGRTDTTSPEVYIIRIDSEQPASSSHLLEVHREYLDIHITLAGTDRIVFKDLAACSEIEREFDKAGDYSLFKDSFDCSLMVPPNYFCLIDPTLAHMAMTGEGAISKLVIKVKCI